MYFLDPDRGSRRRIHARNQIVHASHRLSDSSRAQLRALRRELVLDDDRVVAERVRSMLGHVVSHAHALALDVSRGVVTLSGPILRDEVRLALKALKHVPGVRRVVNALEPHPAPHRMPGLDRDSRLAWMRDRGTPVRRIAAALVSAAGLGLMARAALRTQPADIE
jgi:hypothetical protein